MFYTVSIENVRQSFPHDTVIISHYSTIDVPASFEMLNLNGLETRKGVCYHGSKKTCSKEIFRKEIIEEAKIVLQKSPRLNRGDFFLKKCLLFLVRVLRDGDGPIYPVVSRPHINAPFAHGANCFLDILFNVIKL